MSTTSTSEVGQPAPAGAPESQLARWGGVAGIAGFVSLLGSVVVVVSMDLPDASDVETLTDFADIESGRILEHLFYLGALMLFALHISALHRLLRSAHPPAALFGTVVATTGLVIMAASSLLHVSTAPLADLYTVPDNSAQDRASIEHAWHGAQSVFDAMLVTGAFLVPIGITLLGVAMRSGRLYGTKTVVFTIAIGIVGALGAMVEIIDPSTDATAVAVLCMAVFNLVVGWRTLRLDAGV